MTDKPPSKADGLRAMREATYEANHTNPKRKQPEAKPSGLDAKGPSKTPVTPADRVVSRLGAGRTAQDSPRSETAEAGAIRKAGRPRKSDSEHVSRATRYRRQKEKQK